MYKGIEWLKGRFRGRKIFKPQNDREIGYNMAIDEFSEYVNQLDEPEVLSQPPGNTETFSNAMGQLADELNRLGDLERDIENLTDMTLEEIKETARNGGVVPKQKLPVVPKFVGEYIDRHKNKTNLSEIMCATQIESEEYSTGERKNMDTIFGWIIINQNLFARAWLDGFTVEKEQKYYVLDTEDIPLLEIANNQTCKTTTGLSIYEDGRDNSRFELTEQEIKDYDERYIPFMVPVDEVNND